MAKTNDVAELLAKARRRVARLKAKGWTKKDFARQLGKFFKRQNRLAEIRAKKGQA